MARKDLPSPNAPNFLPRVREEVHALLGKLGSSTDRALTLRDAIESGVIVPGPGGSLIPGPGAGAAEEPDLTPPPQPGAFTATGAISHFLISQAQPFYTQGHGHSRTVVYGAQWVSGPLPVFADAVELDRFGGTVRAIASNPATTWHLWIKWESVDGVLSATPSGGTNGVAVTTGQDVALLLDALAGQITSTELASSLSTPIGQIPSISGIAAEALTKANANLAAIGAIQTELAELSGTPDYSASETYELDEIVKYSGGLYRALGTTTGNLPTNTTYWQKIGDYASLGDAVSAHAAQLSDHETRITDAEGDLTAEASARETLATQLRGSYAGTDIAMVSAGLIHSERQARTTADSTEVSARQALSAKLTGATDPASLTLGTLASGLLYEERQARASNDAAQVGRIETMEAAVNNPSTGLATKASLTQLATVESNAAGALATAQTTLNSTIAGLGGENLYTDRDPLVSGPTMYGDAVYIKNGPINPLGLVPGEALTLSADLARDAAAASDGAHTTLYMWWQNEAGSWVGSAAISGYTDVPTRPSQSVVLPAIASNMVMVGVGVYKQGGTTNVAGTATARRIQIERGSVATAYKVGLRNASAAITTLQQTQASQGLSIASLTTAVQAAQDTADSKASTSYVDSVEARVDTVEGTVSSQGTQIGGLSSDLSDLTGVVATKANASALTETNTNVSNLAGTVSAQAGQITTIQSRVDRMVNYLIRSAGSTSQGVQYPGVFSETGAALTAGVRSYVLVVFNGSTGAIESAVHYDVFGNGEVAEGRNAAALAAALNALGADKVVAVYTWDEPRGNRLTGGLPEAMYRCGASRSIFGAPDSVFRFRSAYILVGIPGIGEGAGIERYAGATDGDPLAYCEYSLQLVNGRPVGMGGNPLNATVQTEISTRASQTGELYAQNTVKIDVGGLISGYGLASTASNAAPTSAFGVQAGQFFVAPPAVASATAPTVGLFKGYAWRDTVANVTKYWTGSAWSTSPQALPFVVQAVPQTINGFTVEPGIYADAAFFARLVATRGQIGLLAVDDARIASVSVGKLTAGSISVGEYLQSTGYVPGAAGLRLNGDGTAELSQVVVRGTIFASQGAIGGWNIGANYLQSTTYVLGESGTRLNSDGTGQIGGVRITDNTLESTTFDTPAEPFGFRLRNDGASELKGAVIRSGSGKVLLTAVGDAVPPWVTTLQQANEDGITLVSDPDPATNTAKIKSLSAGYLIDIDTTDDLVTIAAIPPTIATRIDQTQNSTTWADAQGVSWPVETNQYYEFEALACVNAPLSAVKDWEIGIVLPSGTVARGMSFQYGTITGSVGVAPASLIRDVYQLDGNGRLVFTCRQTSDNANQPIGMSQSIKAYLYTTTSGVVSVQFRRASGANSNILQRGSIFKLRKANIAPELGALASPQTFPTTAASTRTGTYEAKPSITVAMKTDGTWYISRSGTTTLTGNWMGSAPLGAGPSQNFDVKFEVTARSIGGSGPDTKVSTSFTASNWTQMTSERKAAVTLTVDSYGAPAGTRTCFYSVTVKVRQRSTQVETTLGTIACTLTGTVTATYDIPTSGGGD